MSERDYEAMERREMAADAHHDTLLLVRELMEVIERGFQAVGHIAVSEKKLMNKEVREGLDAFIGEAVGVVDRLEILRVEDASRSDTWQQFEQVGGKPEDVIDLTIDGMIGHVEPDGHGGADMVYEPVEHTTGDLDPDGHLTDASTVMCRHTKAGVPCGRTLHNVGLHTPEGYPETESWTDRESDA